MQKDYTSDIREKDQKESISPNWWSTKRDKMNHRALKNASNWRNYICDYDVKIKKYDEKSCHAPVRTEVIKRPEFPRAVRTC